MAATALNFKTTSLNTKKTIQVIDFIEDFMRWSNKRKDIRALGLTGSYARQDATENSDVDLVIIVDKPADYLTDISWTRVFGRVIAKRFEGHAYIQTLRVWYENGLEVEYAFTSPEWVRTAASIGMKRLVEKDLRVLFEKEPILNPTL